MDASTTPDGTGIDASTPDGSVAPGIEQPTVHGEAATPGDTPATEPDSLDAYLASAPEHIRSEYEAGAYRHRDYTQKRQQDAEDRRAWQAERSALLQRLEALEQRGPTPQPSPEAAPAKEWSPEEVRANPAGFIEDLAARKAGELFDQKMRDLGLNDVRGDLEGLRFERTVRGAFNNWLSEDPGRMADPALGEAVGRVLDTDPGLRRLAQSDPQAAIAAAGQIAAAQRQAQAAQARLEALKQKAQTKAAAAPLSTQSGTPAVPDSSKTSYEVAAEALREAGLF